MQFCFDIYLGTIILIKSIIEIKEINKKRIKKQKKKTIVKCPASYYNIVCDGQLSDGINECEYEKSKK